MKDDKSIYARSAGNVYRIALVKIIVVTKRLGVFRTYRTRTLIESIV